MRNTFLLAVFVASGCFNPHLTDGGFACDPHDTRPCPDGYFCRPKADIYVCTRSAVVPTPPGDDLATSTDSSDLAMAGGPSDLAMSGSKDMATGGVADLAMPATCTLANVTINEVQTSTLASASDEFIELYNSCTGTVTLAGSLVYRSRIGTTDTVLVASLSGKTIPARSWFLATGTGYLGGATSDVIFPSGLSDTGGGVALRDAGGAIVDSMGWGSTTSNGFQQGTPASNFNATMSRIPDGVNTHNNSADFTDSTTPTPRAANKP